MKEYNSGADRAETVTPAICARKSVESTAPRLVTRGESSTPPSPAPLDRKHLSYAILTDWLNFTVRLKPTTSKRKYDEALSWLFVRLELATGLTLSPQHDRNKGLNGWKESYSLGNSGAMMGRGGQRDTLLFTFSGDACSGIASDRWDELANLLDEYDATITRWDGACDDFRGEHSVDFALDLFRSGAFSTGGKKPSVQQHGDFISGTDTRGRTLYVGSRKSGKLLRIYEKGKQLGDALSPWVRWELELHNTDRVVTTDVLRNPAQFIAGAYSCMGWISGEVTRIPTFRNLQKAGYDCLTRYCRESYGKHINAMLAVEGSAEAVVQKLARTGLPARLSRERPADVSKALRSSEPEDE